MEHEPVGPAGAPRRSTTRPVVLLAVSLAGGAVLAGTFLLLRPDRPDDGAPQPPGRGDAPFPTRETTGVPEGWEPVRVVRGDLEVDTPGAVVEDVRILDGSLLVDATDVTVRRVEILGGGINNFPGPVCSDGLVVEDTTIRSSGPTTEDQLPAIAYGGYTALRVLLDGVPEGFRVGGAGSGCGPVTVVDSFASVRYPDDCTDWHGDAVQGYDGPALVIRNTTLELVQTADCGGTAAFFYPADQGNTTVDVDGLLVSGGGYPFRLGTAGTVSDLAVVDGSWTFGPIDVRCSALTEWDAAVVEAAPDGTVRRLRPLPCDTDGGG
ncbi:hypothetical protein [Georgenia muralis]|uniref:Uncharacterized protein n=1 Tax=Georgenia muralis TaxID=154117 RepID=A0A3N4Z0F2_9MICO|nr:hypothetical protein [Georgenia muralis]RPF26077.1 hypothetical protein EDD32_0501 [Georgenia muralis]